MTHGPRQAFLSARQPIASTVLHFPLCPHCLNPGLCTCRGSCTVTSSFSSHRQLAKGILTKAELMASTNSSSSMLTSSAACSCDVDQTKELKVSESCIKRRASAWCGGTCLQSQYTAVEVSVRPAWGTVLKNKQEQREPALLNLGVFKQWKLSKGSNAFLEQSPLNQAERK